MSIDLKNYVPAMMEQGTSLFSGAGAPSFTANKGSIYVNLTGSSSSTRMYINSDGATTWVSVTTSA